MSIKDQKLIYHLTDIENLENIIKEGLLSRKELEERGDMFEDVADPDILIFREEHNLNQYVPFHFFSKNPFDGKVQKKYPDKEFVYLCMKRRKAENMGFEIIPSHPLNMNPFQVYSYEDGMEMIDWEKMEQRDYKDHACKEVCMAECVYNGKLQIEDFVSINVRTKAAEKYVKKLFDEHGISQLHINLTPDFFVRKREEDVK